MQIWYANQHKMGLGSYDWPEIPIPQKYRFFGQALAKRNIELQGASPQFPQNAGQSMQAEQDAHMQAINAANLREVLFYFNQHTALWNHIEAYYRIICKGLLNIEERRVINVTFIEFSNQTLMFIIQAAWNYFIVFYQLLETERNACEHVLLGHHMPLYSKKDLQEMSDDIHIFFNKFPLTLSYSPSTYCNLRLHIHHFNQKIKCRLEKFIKA